MATNDAAEIRKDRYIKTLNDIYDEVVASDELKEKFLALKTPEELVELVKSFGVDASLDEIKAFFVEKQSNVGELSDEVSEGDLKQVAGGKGANLFEGLNSVVTLGTGCALLAFISDYTGDCGTAIEGDAMLCSEMA